MNGNLEEKAWKERETCVGYSTGQMIVDSATQPPVGGINRVMAEERPTQ